MSCANGMHLAEQGLATDLAFESMNLEAFLLLMPADLGESLVPASRAMLMHRTSKKTRAAIARMHCRVDVQPSKEIRQQYTDENVTLHDRRVAVRLYVARSLQLSMGAFRIRSFTLHGMVLGHTATLNAMLHHSRGLEILDLYNNHIPEDMTSGVFAAIPASLKVLRLARQWINRAAVAPLCELLTRLTVLEELDLSENYLNSSGMGALTASVASGRLSRVALGFNHLKSRFWNEYPELGLDRFVLTALDLRHNMLQAVFCDSMYACVRGSAAMLQSLDLSYNDLRLAGISYLSAALEKCNHLKHLNIAGNLCGDAALTLLLSAVRPREPPGIPLETLDVAHNSLTCASARAFCRCMNGNVALRRSLNNVSFSNNELGDVGAMLVVEALLSCDMKELSLAQITMGEMGGLCLAGIMLHWPTLRVLEVHGNRLCSTSLLLIARAMCENDGENKHMKFIGNWVLGDLNERVEQILEGAHVSHGFVQRHTPRALARA